MNKPMFSVGIPAYKSSFLSKAIESVLNQTIQNLELIIVNDASPYPVSEVVAAYDDKRIKYYINEKNIGGKDPTANWNKCLSYSNGQYFSLLCDDDYYEPTFLEEMLKLAEKHPNCKVFRAGVSVVDKNNRVINFYPSLPEWETSTDYIWHVSFHLRKQTVSEWMYEREHIVNIGGYESIPMAWGS